ncbi:uncharacterized protein BDW70DRAFT_128176 [Aspergillus foveolatus]|uniref:uncharacterized protein n=1 Tax=Aspergillus foveolatus TaxID=210207 RepID=UPI003CCCA68C
MSSFSIWARARTMCVNRLSYIDWCLLVSFEVACLVCPSGSGHSDPGHRCLVGTMDHVLCEDDLFRLIYFR